MTRGKENFKRVHSRFNIPLSESAFYKTQVKPWLKQNNILFFRIETDTKRGIPDIIICRKGGFIGLELKRDAMTRPTKIQTLMGDYIKKHGGEWHVVHPDNFNEIKKKIIQVNFTKKKPSHSLIG